MSFQINSENNDVVSQLKTMIATLTKQNESMQQSNLTLQAQVESLQEQLGNAVKKNKWYEEQIKLGKHRQFAKQSETS